VASGVMLRNSDEESKHIKVGFTNSIDKYSGTYEDFAVFRIYTKNINLCSVMAVASTYNYNSTAAGLSGLLYLNIRTNSNSKIDKVVFEWIICGSKISTDEWIAAYKDYDDYSEVVLYKKTTESFTVYMVRPLMVSTRYRPAILSSEATYSFYNNVGSNVLESISEDYTTQTATIMTLQS